MKQETEDPDMKGTPPNGPDKSKGNAEQKKIEVPVKPQKSAKESSDVIADSPLSQPPVTDMNQKKENIKQVDFLPDPADFFERKRSRRYRRRCRISRGGEGRTTILGTVGNIGTFENRRRDKKSEAGDIQPEFLGKMEKAYLSIFLQRFESRQSSTGT